MRSTFSMALLAATTLALATLSTGASAKDDHGHGAPAKDDHAAPAKDDHGHAAPAKDSHADPHPATSGSAAHGSPAAVAASVLAASAPSPAPPPPPPATPMPSPAEALALLVAGNSDFSGGKAVHPRQDSRRLLMTAGGQKPFVTVLSCSDSRVVPEVLFDQGVGDVFVVRVAGNVAGHDEMGSIEYGVDHLGTPLLVVLGHTKCGAVTAVCKGAEVHGHIPDLIEKIKPAVEATKKKLPTLAPDEIVPEAIRANVVTSMGDLILQSPAIRKRLKDSKVRVVGGVYNIETGRVEWLGSHPDEAKLITDGDALPAPHHGGGGHGDGHGEHGPGGEPGAPGAEPHAEPGPPPNLPIAFAAVALLGTIAGAVSMMLIKRAP